jgi:hypothetical protein
MAHAPTASCHTVARPDQRGPSFALLGGVGRQERVFAALRASLAHETLPALAADVRTLLPTMTWAQIAQTLRVTRSPAWRSGLTVTATAAPHQVLWLLVGGDAPSPRQLPGGYHRSLVDTLVAKVEKSFEAEVRVEHTRGKRAGGTWDLPAARARVACSLPWSAPADLPMLRALMTDATGAAAKLGAALRAVDPPCAPTPRPPTPPSCTRSDSRMPLPLDSPLPDL